MYTSVAANVTYPYVLPKIITVNSITTIGALKSVNDGLDCTLCANYNV